MPPYSGKLSMKIVLTLRDGIFNAAVSFSAHGGAVECAFTGMGRDFAGNFTPHGARYTAIKGETV